MSLKAEDAAATLESPAGAVWRDRVLAVVRIAVGAYWLWEQHWKLPPDFGLHQPRGLMFAFQQGIQYPTLGIYKTFLQAVVVPHFFLFGWLIFMGETAIGISLLLGVLTKLGALLGTLQAANLLIGAASAPEGPWIYLALLAANILLLLTPCNRHWSVDHRLAPKLARPAAGGSRLARALLRTM